MADQAKKRRCTATTKTGKRCKAWALHGHLVCMSHADKAVQAKAGFGGSENAAKGGAAKRVPKLSELLRQRVEEQADEILDRLFGMLDAQRAVVVGTGPKARIEVVDDPELILRAIREIFDRAEGRPKSVSEFSGKVEHKHSDQLDRAIEAELQRLSERLAEQHDGDREPSS